MTNLDCHVGKEVGVVVFLEEQEVAADYIETVYQTPLEVVGTLVAIAAPSVFAFPLLVADPSAASLATAGPCVAFLPTGCTCEQSGSCAAAAAAAVDNSTQMISRN